jgi:hypothetical protein
MAFTPPLATEENGRLQSIWMIHVSAAAPRGGG